MPSRSSSVPKLSLARALALGALHGPAELLPISSSGHLTAIPWLLGWDFAELDPELRKAFEVALHAGTTAALVAGEGLALERPVILATASAPPAILGFILERPIEREAGKPALVAIGLAAGGLAMLLADRAPQRRSAGEANAMDGLWLGLAQACALLPGVSRSGTVETAARFRGFRRADAQGLAARIAPPVIIGAGALKGLRLLREGPEGADARRLAAGATASFISTFLARPLTGGAAPGRLLAPYAVYRLALATVVLRRAYRGPRRI